MADEENTTLYKIKVKNAFLSYGKNNVINGLNMNIKSGSIYGLLGSSGCGKSSLLQCILGIIKLDFGSIELNADSIKDIGYMPQDLCLDDALTIQELFVYYGSLYNINKTKFKNRTDELSKFLKLPSMNSYIKHLSGGQCRRVSLAITLLHDPKIIILDEPTVGIDSILRNDIWTEFIKMSENKKQTIIITTHYIEEAKEANCVGLMRNGKLIEEGSPEDILNKYNTDTLESAFLTLCCNQEVNQIIQNDDYNNIEQVKYKTKNLGKSENLVSYSRIKALLEKNLRVFGRDYFLIFTLIILPILLMLNVNYGIGSNIDGLSIAVKNDEIDYVYCKTHELNGCISDENNNQSTSCIIMDYYRSLNYKMISVYNHNDGEEKLKDSKYVAFIHFPQNYTKELTKFIDRLDEYDIKQQAYIHVNTDNVLFKNTFLNDLRDSFNYLIDKTLNDCGNNPRSIKVPIDFNTAVGKEVKSYTNSIASTFVTMVALYFPCVFSMSIMQSERMDGILSRSMFAGVTALELMISLFCIFHILLVIQISTSLFVMHVYFSNPIIISDGLIAYVILLFILGWIGFIFGILIACLIPSRVGGIYAVNGWCQCQFLVAGAIWPIETQPQYLKSISKLFPMRLGGKALSDITLKGWSFDHHSVSFSITILFGYASILLLVLIIFGKYKKDMWVMHK